jgi:hypothetical protein
MLTCRFAGVMEMADGADILAAFSLDETGWTFDLWRKPPARQENCRNNAQILQLDQLSQLSRGYARFKCGHLRNAALPCGATCLFLGR